ncbi:transmembrane protein 45A isoform X2 [Erinaceus europaeus]|nr:transmembrane protein 45A isoform X2 [Erinaceus europaeus]XP_060028186.1 transmembrane protein 45A isoform X2 [Erinaceus europaeus]XP_060028187.1 transmembrane protein 45A isoform X2 [Erinaceus europaeus]
MGSFRGHAIPGTFFIVMGMWWSTKNFLKYACRKHKRASYVGSKALFQRIEISEGIIIILMALTGMLGEQFTTGGPRFTLYDYKESRWTQLTSWHHWTMYFFFGLLGTTNILCYTVSSLPASLTKLMLSNALFVEAFIFYNHTHGREMLDIFVHQLLFLVILLAAVVAFMQLFVRTHIVTLDLLLSSLVLFQGTWFWQVGFVLYPPRGGPAWNQMEHENIMFLSICFCWHYAVSLVITGVDYIFVTWLVKTRLKRIFPSEVGLLKHVDRDQESEEEM